MVSPRDKIEKQQCIYVYVYVYRFKDDETEEKAYTHI